MLPIQKTKEWLLWDLETNGLLDTVSVIHCCVILDLKTNEVTRYRPHQIEEALRRIMAAEYITGHRIVEYDILVAQKLYPWFKPMGQITDTLYVSRLLWSNLRRDDFVRVKKGDKFPKHLCGRHSLESWGHRFGLHKGDYAKLMKERGLDPWAEFNEEMLDYCEQDIHVNHKLWRIIRQKNPDRRSVRLEHDIARIILDQEAWGVGFDEAKAAKLYGKLAARRDELLEQCRTLFPMWVIPDPEVKVFKSSLRQGVKEYGKRWVRRFGRSGQELKHQEVFNVYRERVEGQEYCDLKIVEFNPSSRQQVADRLITLYGWQPTVFNSPDDEDSDGGDIGKPKVNDEILSNLPYEPAKLLCEYYVVEKRLGALADGKNAWLRHLVDGKIHGKVNPQGTPTGRATHSSPNLGQVPSITNAKGPVPYGKECRELFRPTRKGWVQVGADASGLELRCLGHELFPYDNGAYGDIVLNGDIHWANAIALGLVAPGTVRDKTNHAHDDARAVAKRFIYAFLYGGGPEMIGSIAGVDTEEVHRWGQNKAIRNRLVKDGRHPDPALVAVIRKGQLLMEKFLANLPALKAMKDKIAADLKTYDGHLIGLDGRLLPSRSAHSALNLLLQADGAIICKKWIVQFHEDMEAAGYVKGVDWAQMLWVHDEIQIECRPEIAEHVAEIAKAAVPKAGAFFNFKIPLGGDALVGNNWADCH